MRLLLDTHMLIWSARAVGRLSKGEKRSMDRASEIVVSAVSIWEIHLKSAHTRPSRLDLSPDDAMQFVELAGWTMLPLSARHAATTLTHSVPHADPFDRVLLAQAQAEGLRLLTRDGKLEDHPLALTR